MSSDRDRIRALEGHADQFKSLIKSLNQETDSHWTEINKKLSEKVGNDVFLMTQTEIATLRQQLEAVKNRDLSSFFTHFLNEQLGQECERLAENEKLATECRLLKEETKKTVASMQERIALMQKENQKLRAELEQHTTLSWWQHLVYGLIGSHK